MIAIMKKKISHYSSDFQLGVNNEQRENEKKEQGQGLIIEEDLIEKRNKEIQDIYNTIETMKQMKADMVKSIQEQGALLADIEKDVIESEDNARKAKKEIEEADKLSKDKKKRVIFFIVIISFVLIALGFLGFGIYKLANKNK